LSGISFSILLSRTFFAGSGAAQAALLGQFSHAVHSLATTLAAKKKQKSKHTINRIS
jgi:formiminotetrahydrofolate cyclodeaminase